MNYEQKIKELEAQIEELKQKIESEKAAPPVWVPGEEDHYYVLTIQGDVVEYFWSGTGSDCARLDMGNVFRTEQEAENCLRALKLIETIRRERYRSQGGLWPGEYEARYTMHWDQLENGIGTDHTGLSFSSDVFGFWRYSAVLRDVIKKYESELKWYFTEYLPSVN